MPISTLKSLESKGLVEMVSKSTWDSDWKLTKKGYDQLRNPEEENEKAQAANQMTTSESISAMLKFALLHDWGNRALIPTGCEALHVWDTCTNQVVVFYDMRTLKAWAGY